MRLTASSLMLPFLLCLGGAAGAQGLSDQAVRDSGRASGQVSAGAASAINASGRATLGVSAVPLASGGAVLGSTGAASTAIARDSAAAAMAPIGTPLQVTDETITVVPPNQALRPEGAR